MEDIMRKRRAIFLVIAGLASGCAALGGKDLPLSLEVPLAGSEFSDEFPVAEMKIPLPKGSWTLIGTEITKEGTRGFNAAYMLIKADKDRLLSAVEIYTNITIRKSGQKDTASYKNSGEGWVTHSNCTRDDMHFIKVYSNIRLGEQDCWWVNHWRMNRVGRGNTEHWKEAVKYLSENKIRAPLDMLAVTYRMADKADYLTVNYFFNPQTSGFRRENDIYWQIDSWKTSAWNPDRVKDDEKKQAYIKSIIAWGETWHEKLKRAFKLE